MPTITKRNNTYRITVSLGNDSTGKQIRKYMTYKPSSGMTEKQIEKEVQKQAVLFEEKCQKGLYLDGSIKFSEFADKWFTDYAEHNLKAKTLYRYRLFLKRINPAIGHIHLDKLQPHHLTQFYNNLKESGIREDVKYKSKINFREFMDSHSLTKSKLSEQSDVSVYSIGSVIAGDNVNYETALKISDSLNMKLEDIFTPADDTKTLSDKTVHHYHAFISSVLSTAVQWQVIFSNPCERVKPPKVTKKEARYLEENELESLVEILDTLPEDESQNVTMIKLLIFTGLRRGELCGLKWCDVDFNRRELNIERNLLYLPDKGIYEDTPKTETSTRSISISDSIIALLTQHRIWQTKKRLEVGDQWNDTEYLFTSYNGLPLHPDTISSWFRKLIEKYNLPDVSIHSLRHTNATLLLMNGLPVKTVSSRLGHSNAVTTSNIYSHALKSKEEKASEIMDDIITKKKKA